MSIAREVYTRKWMWVLTGAVVGAGLSGALSYRQHRAPVTQSLAPDGVYCDSGIGVAKAHAATALARAAPSIEPIDRTAWIPKINDKKPPESAPVGMTWIPGGQFWMGTTEDHMTDARPWHRVYVDGYWIDKTEVTNEQFARFVKATGYGGRTYASHTGKCGSHQAGK
jgi:formylglycine-generating enzyme required for sulfatase activity